ncbi:baculoviral iap repeat-containing protein 5 [Plakobranchus ocellatus]|uniref:Baculoviral iap repeat-containing protein 5 n=1 Tax=Plakobranchus ocellatus TaxID=259542 RepID=A0AAV3ZV49_9GAST|nr:baculoviral iap repeat-containing protein 5 [Plakobranchus ocellatus]
MGSEPVFGIIIHKDIRLLCTSERLKTFEAWPNEVDCKCTPEKLAEAGFYFHPCKESPDNVCCVFCDKELDGWEPDDDPMLEHKKHSKKCPYLAMPQPFSPQNLTIREFWQFIQNITLENFSNQVKKEENKCLDYAASIQEAIRKHVLG